MKLCFLSKTWWLYILLKYGNGLTTLDNKLMFFYRTRVVVQLIFWLLSVLWLRMMFWLKFWLIPVGDVVRTIISWPMLLWPFVPEIHTTPFKSEVTKESSVPSFFSLEYELPLDLEPPPFPKSLEEEDPEERLRWEFHSSLTTTMEDIPFDVLLLEYYQHLIRFNQHELRIEAAFNIEVLFVNISNHHFFIDIQ